MSGVIGATTNKFLMIAATLVMPMRVDRERVHAAIDAAEPVTVISTRLAAKLHIEPLGDASTAPAPLRRPVQLSIGAESFTVDAIEISDAPFTRPQYRGQDLILGRDALAAHLFSIDFPAHSVSLVLPFEMKRYTRGFSAVPLDTGPDGALRVRARIDDGAAVSATLDLGDETPVSTDDSDRHETPAATRPQTTVQLRIGDVDLGAMPGVSGTPGEPAPTHIGLGAFRHARLVLDLPHHLLWVRAGK